MLTNRRLNRSAALFVTLLVISFGLMTLDVRSSGGGVVETLRTGARSLVAPVQRVLDDITRPIADFADGIVNLAGYRAENQLLREQLEEAQRRLAESEAVFAQNEELRLLLNLGLPQALERRVARVQAGGTSNFDFSVVIDKGRLDGVGVDMPVVNGQGLVGRVVGVTDHSASVALLTSPTHSVKVRVVDTIDRGTASGRGSDLLTLLISNAEAPVELGQLVMTDAGRYPADLLVGTVAEAAIPEAGFVLQTTVAPAVDFGRLDFVAVLLYTGDQAGAGVDDPAPIEPDPSPPGEGGGAETP